jgi:hypothetical protein
MGGDGTENSRSRRPEALIYTDLDIPNVESTVMRIDTRGGSTRPCPPGRGKAWLRQQVCWCVLLSALVLLRPAATIARTVAEVGGSDFVTIATDPDRLVGDENWRSNAVFRTPACQYDTETAEVDRRLRAMRQAGQRKLGLIIWFAQLHQAQECAGFLANSSGGHLPPRILANLEHLIRTAGALNFDEVQVRFAPMAHNWPIEWQEWEEATYAENWGLINSTIAATARSDGPHVVYDLSAELAGYQAPGCSQCELYVRRLWSDYVRKYSPQDSYGFSVAMPALGRVERLLADLKQAGPLPAEVAIDTYSIAHPGLMTTAEEMRSEGVHLPVLIQETLYDDAEMYQALITQARQNDLQLKAIMQWPLTAGQHRHISEPETPAYRYWPVD